MLEPWIIEEIKRKQKTEIDDRPQLEIYIEDDWMPKKKIIDDNDYKSKIITIDLDISED